MASMEPSIAALFAELDRLGAGSAPTAAADRLVPMTRPVQVSADQIQFVAGNGSCCAFSDSTMLISERPTPSNISTSRMDILGSHNGLLTHAAAEPLTLWPRGLGHDLYSLQPMRVGYCIAMKPSADPAHCLDGVGHWRLDCIVSVDDDAPTAVLQNQEKIRQHSAHRFGGVDTDQRFRRGEGPISLLDVDSSAGHISQQSVFATEEYVQASLRLLEAVQSGAAAMDFKGVSLFQSAPGVTTAQGAPVLIDSSQSTTTADAVLASFCAELNAHPSAIRRYMSSEPTYFPGVAVVVLSQSDVSTTGCQRENEQAATASSASSRANPDSDNSHNAVYRSATALGDRPADEVLRELLAESDAEKAHFEQLMRAAGVSENDAALPDSEVAPPAIRSTGVSSASKWSAPSSISSVEDLVDAIDSNILATTPAPQLQNSRSVAFMSWADPTALDLSEFELLRPRLAMTHSFELDFFQKQAVMRLERRECVFVAAHTSAGKTVVAEYAIAMARNHLTRAIYTSPIKALSNQKYRDFKERFDDIGLITGDVSVNPDASCLIMTTEILRSMLYRGSDVIKDIEWVIFDEVHYVNDIERGVVWEEVIIMLPDRINLIFLSATTPNTIEFSDWIGRTKRKKVYVISTSYRPVPLQHYLLHNEDIYPIMGRDGKYNSTVIADATKREKEKSKPKEKRPENVAMGNQRQMEKAAIAAQNRGGAPSKKGTVPSGKPLSKPTGTSGGAMVVGGGRSQWNALLKLLLAGGREGNVNSSTMGVDFGTGFSSDLMVKKEKHQHIVPYERLPQAMRDEMTKKEYDRIEFNASDGESGGSLTTGAGCLLPVVVFCFSKKKCEEIVDFFKGQDLLVAHEKFIVRALKAEALGRLNPSDAKLPQVLYIFDMLARGFGVHHGGLLPILKESVEVLFSQSIVKMLIATETFAMGVNMPARSVVFHSIRKHDGRAFRDLLPGEYTQMAGRAGRRGLDKVGTVIIAAWTELPSEITLKTLVTGTARKLVSQFRLSYNMILNLLRANDLNVEDMIKRSFSEFAIQRAVSNKDTHQALIKSEKFLTLINNQISDDISNVSKDSEAATQSMFEDLHESLRQSYELTQAFISSSVRTNPPDKTRRSEGITVNDCTVVPLLNLSLAINRGRIFLCKRCDCAVIAMALSEPLFPLKEEPVIVATANSNANAGSSLSDIRKKLLATSVQPTVSSNVNATMDKGESVIDEALKDGFVIALVLLPPANSTTDLTMVEDSPHLNKALITGEYTSDSGLLLNYSIERVKLADIAVITDALDFTALSVDPITYSDVNINNSVQTLFHFVRALKNNAIQGTLHALDLQKTLRRSDIDAAVMQNQLDAASQYVTLYGIHSLHNGDYQRLHRLFERRALLCNRINGIKRLLSHDNISLFPDFQQRLAVLSCLGYLEGVAGQEVVTLKGRVACEMNTCDELLATEAIFANLLEPLNPPEAAAVLSAFIFQEKSDEEQQLTSRMEVAKKQLKIISASIEKLQEAMGVEVFERNSGSNDKGSKNTHKSSGSLNFGLCAVVYEWARGTSFKDIAAMSDVKEGSIVRCITRVDELCRDVRNAARALGNPSLYRKMEAASQCIKRDIVFAASLYVT